MIEIEECLCVCMCVVVIDCVCIGCMVVDSGAHRLSGMRVVGCLLGCLRWLS